MRAAKIAKPKSPAHTGPVFRKTAPPSTLSEQASADVDAAGAQVDQAAGRREPGLRWDFSKIPVVDAEPMPRQQAPEPDVAEPGPRATRSAPAMLPIDDPLEHEAERVANHVEKASMAAVYAAVLAAAPQRGGSAGNGQAEATRTAFSDNRPSSRRASPQVESALSAGGRPLDAVTRAYFETRFGRDFSPVRVHDEPAAHASAARLQARAYTVGCAIVFGQGEFAPATSDGRRLLGHELTHVVQHAGAAALPVWGERRAGSGSTAWAYPAISSAPVPSVARKPRGDGDFDEESDELAYKRQEAEDKAQQSRKQGRGGRANADAPRSAAQVSREAEAELEAMIGKAQRGEYRDVNTAHRQRETNRFRGILDRFLGDELRRINAAIAKLPKTAANKNARTQLNDQKRGVYRERSNMKKRFDEAMRTPAGVDAQKHYIHGGQAHDDYHDLRPGKGSYAQPDYSELTFKRGAGVTHVHVNLKAHDLRNLKPAKARAVAREVLKQAVKNVSGDPTKVRQVGHLPDGDRLVISFIDQPSKAIQDEISGILFGKDSPIAEVRFGTVSKVNQRPTAPALKPGLPASEPPTPNGSTPPERTQPSRANAPRGSVVEEPLGPVLPKGSVFEQPPAGTRVNSTEPPRAPVLEPPAMASAPHPGTTSRRFGRTAAEVEVRPGGSASARVTAIDLAELPEQGVPSGPRASGSRLQTGVQLVQFAKLALSLAREVVNEKHQDTLDHLITPIQAHFNDQLKDATKAFNTNYPDAQTLAAATGVEKARQGYENAASRMQMPQNARVAMAVMLALTPDSQRDDNWRRMAENLPKGSVRQEDVTAAQEAAQIYSLAMAEAQTQINQLRLGMPGIVADITQRAGILNRAADELETIFWSLIQSPLAAYPVTYYALFDFYNESQVFRRFASGLYGLAGEVKGKLDGYEAMWADLDRRHLALKTFD